MFASQKPAPDTVFGPYSAWPRRRVSARSKVAMAVSVLAAGGFVHCVLPMIAA
jgi:hypothetical protein